jgi:hypothetical protein
MPSSVPTPRSNEPVIALRSVAREARFDLQAADRLDAADDSAFRGGGEALFGPLQLLCHQHWKPARRSKDRRMAFNLEQRRTHP